MKSIIKLIAFITAAVMTLSFMAACTNNPADTTKAAADSKTEPAADTEPAESTEAQTTEPATEPETTTEEVTTDEGPTLYDVYRWDFNDADNYGWIASNMTDISAQEDGTMKLTVKGGDPNITTKIIPVKIMCEDVEYIEMRVKNKTDSYAAQLFISTTDSPGPAEQYSLKFDYEFSDEDDEWEIIEIDTLEINGWTGRLRALRFDYCDGSEGDFYIDYITLQTTDPSKQSSTSETEAETESTTKPDIKDGMMIYYEDFSSYGTVTDTDAVLSSLGWRILTTEYDFAPSNWTAFLSIHDGVLEVNNYDKDKNFSGTDGYALMFDENYMKRAVNYGSYTLQYDVTYTGAGNYKRYINIVTEYDDIGYNSYHFRVGGYANNQLYFNGKWYTYDAPDENDLSSPVKENGNGLTTIAYKLLGISDAIESDTAINNFKNKTVTIRICREKGLAKVYMKTPDMSDFILVSAPSENGDGYGYEAALEGYGVCFKPGGAINGTVDNIAIWTGTGEMPADKTITYTP